MRPACIARQPIVDVRREVHGYELLFRAAPGDLVSTAGREDERATASVVLRSLIGLGLERITAGRPAFINCPARMIEFEGLDVVLPPESVVLEVLETTEPTPAIVRRLHALAARGFRIALDDFVYAPRFEPLLALADYVKIDVQALGTEQLRQHAGLKRRRRCALVAEKVETYEEFRLCQELGFDYFQGWFFCRPETLEGHLPETNKLTALQVVVRILSNDAQIDEIVRLVTLDPALSYCVLRLANSSMYARPVEVESVHEGVMRLGLSGLRRWVAVMLMAGLERKPRELLVTAIVRARMCESLAADLGADAESMFTVGLFSVLDALFDMPLAEVLAELPLAAHVKEALLGVPGDEGRILKAVVLNEKGTWREGGEALVSRERITAAWLEAIAWSQEMLSNLGLADSAAAPKVPAVAVPAK